jgi:hypothetical protein
MKLPSEMNQQVHQELYRQHTEEPMKYVSFAEQQGIEKGALVGKVQMCQELLKQQPTPQAELAALPQEQLETLLAHLRSQLLANGN